jgi:signal peptidase II
MLAVLGAVVALDQLTKQIADANVSPGDPREVLFGFQLANVRNKGVAFGLLTGGKTTVLILTLGALVLLLGYFAVSTTRPNLWLAVGLVGGGALGNLADRIRIGAVIDFLDPPLWPAFNVADISIVGGVVLLVLILGTPWRAD